MRIGVPVEFAEAERRVSIVPDTTRRLVKGGHDVVIQSGAGDGAGYPDSDYVDAGAASAADIAATVSRAEVVATVRGLDAAAIGALPPGVIVIGLLNPHGDPGLAGALAEAGVTSIAMELVPRIARAQRMDALSSQASISGYKAVLIAASALGKYLPMMMTAAGTIPPGRVLVVGAGVAGLQAIATARRLGAVVDAFDVRSAVKEQVESLGARFVDVPVAADAEAAGGYARELQKDEQRAQQQALAERVADADAVITSALVPGRQAPRIISAAMVSSMRPGSVIVDLAAEAGGNCELTSPGEIVVTGGVAIHGTVNLPSTMAHDASRVYSRNVEALLELLADDDGRPELDLEDEVLAAMTLTHEGRVRHGPAATS